MRPRAHRPAPQDPAVKRSATALADGVFDLLVIGGGITGAWTAYDAALRGLRVALVERSDWAAGTSSASSKLIHGGLRYLEYGQFSLVAKSLRERGRLLRLAPHRVQPRRFLLPLWPDARVPVPALAAGLWLYDRLAGARPATPGFAHVDAAAIQARCPWLEGHGLRGGFTYSDAAEDDARFTLEIAAGAAAAGAVAVNRVEAVTLRRGASGAVEGAEVVDALSGATMSVRAHCTVAAAAAWNRGLTGLDLPVRLTKGVHLVLPPLPPLMTASGVPGGAPLALTLSAPQDRRVFFLLPWQGATLVGTTDTDHAGEPDAAVVTTAEVDYLLIAVAARCPGLGWTARDVRGAFAGLRTLLRSGAAASAASREWELLAPAPGLLVPLGGKFTSARVEAVRTVDRVGSALRRRLGPSLTAHRPFPWCPSAPWAEWAPRQAARARALGIDATTAAALPGRYGAHLDAVLTRVAGDPAKARRLVAAHPVIAAELLHAVDHEQALGLVDLLRRRTPLLLLGGCDDDALARAGALVGPGLGWDTARRQQEIADARRLRWE